jgi:hypothetical protein
MAVGSEIFLAFNRVAIVAAAGRLANRLKYGAGMTTKT